MDCGECQQHTDNAMVLLCVGLQVHLDRPLNVAEFVILYMRMFSVQVHESCVLCESCV